MFANLSESLEVIYLAEVPTFAHEDKQYVFTARRHNGEYVTALYRQGDAEWIQGWYTWLRPRAEAHFLDRAFGIGEGA